MEYPGEVPIVKLDQQHDEHKLYASTWEHLDILHQCGPRLEANLAEFIVKRPKELPDVYNERLKRATYQPILSTITGWYLSALFRRPPELQTKPAEDAYSDFLLDCDKGGTPYVDFWSQLAEKLLLFQSVYVLTDLPQYDEPPQDHGEELALGLTKPYIVGYDPQQVINWSTDPYGNLNWIVIRTPERDDDPLDRGVDKTTWTIYDRTSWVKYSVNGTVIKGENGQASTILDSYGREQKQLARLVGQGAHALSKWNRVPIRRVDLSGSLWFAKKAIFQLKDHLNTECELSWALRQGNLAMPVVFTDSNPQIILSEASWLKLAPGDKFEWTEPKGTAADHAAARLSYLREEIYRSFCLIAQGRKATATASGASGYSKEIDMMPSNDILNAIGDVLNTNMQAVLGDVAQASGDTTTEFDVRGFRFEVKPANESIALVQQVLNLGVPSTILEKELFKRVSRDALEDANDDVLTAIAKEIDEAPSQVEQAQQDREAEVAKFGKSMATATARQSITSQKWALLNANTGN